MNSLSLEHWADTAFTWMRKDVLFRPLENRKPKKDIYYQHSLMAFSKLKEDKPENETEGKIISISQTKSDL